MFARFALIDFLVLSSQWRLPAAEGQWYFAPPWLVLWLALALVAMAIAAWLTTRYIPNNYVGIVEKLWSQSGSLRDGQMVALDGEAGFQADLLRGGIHLEVEASDRRISITRVR